MIIKSTPSEAPKVTAKVDGRIMHADPRFEAILLTLHPGETMTEHPNPSDVLFVGISGQASLLSQGQQWTIAAGETIFVSSETMRGWVNNHPDPCQIMVFKVH